MASFVSAVVGLVKTVVSSCVSMVERVMGAVFGRGRPPPVPEMSVVAVPLVVSSSSVAVSSPVASSVVPVVAVVSPSPAGVLFGRLRCATQAQEIDQQKMNEINRLNAIKQQIQRQQAMISNHQRGLGMQGMVPGASYPGGMNMGGASNMVTAYQNAPRMNSLLSMSQQLQNMRNSSPTMGQQGQNKK